MLCTCRLNRASILAVAIALITSQCSLAQFDTIINVPPDVAPSSIGSNTQLNLFDTGVLQAGFQAGNSGGGDTNIEVNVFGGEVGVVSAANEGSTFNISGGTIGTFFDANFGSIVNISGGDIGNVF